MYWAFMLPNGAQVRGLKPLKQDVGEYFGAYALQAAQGLALRYDQSSHNFQEDIFSLV
jgi:hypothetical protein